jgi:hypothetical protein
VGAIDGSYRLVEDDERLDVGTRDSAEKGIERLSLLLLPGEAEAYVDRRDRRGFREGSEQDGAIEAAATEDGYSVHASPR